jgi:hypothetical protein
VAFRIFGSKMQNILFVQFQNLYNFKTIDFNSGLIMPITSLSKESIIRDFLIEHVNSLDKNVTEYLHEIAEDFITTIDAGIGSFEDRWRMRIFHDAIHTYDIVQRMTFEQARKTLQEHLIEPIMVD